MGRRHLILWGAIGVSASLILASCSSSTTPFPEDAWLIGISSDEHEDQGAYFLAFDPEHPELTNELGILGSDDVAAWGDWEGYNNRFDYADHILNVSFNNQWYIDQEFAFQEDGIPVQKDDPLLVYPVTPDQTRHDDREPIELDLTRIPDDTLQEHRSRLVGAVFQQTPDYPHHVIVGISDPSDKPVTPETPITFWRYDVEDPKQKPEHIPEVEISEGYPFWSLSSGFPLDTLESRTEMSAETSFGSTSTSSERHRGRIQVESGLDGKSYTFRSPLEDERHNSEHDVIQVIIETQEGSEATFNSEPITDIGQFHIDWVKPPYQLYERSSS